MKIELRVMNLPRRPQEKTGSSKVTNYRVIASGDSFNDVSMLMAADVGLSTQRIS